MLICGRLFSVYEDVLDVILKEKYLLYLKYGVCSLSYIRIIFGFFGFFFFSLNATECSKAFDSVSKEAKGYPRIDSHIEAYQASCNIVYAYSIFLHNSIEMEELEKDNTYAENLGKFVKNYSYIAKFIINKKTFEFFERYYSPDKKSINTSIGRSFNKIELKDEKNLIYVIFALDVLSDNFDSNNLTKMIKHLKQRYTYKEMDVIMKFWGTFKIKYSKKMHNQIRSFSLFEQIVDSYGLLTLKKYNLYAVEFYPVLLPEDWNNTEYIETIKSLLRELKIKSTTLEQQAYFLKNISIDIQVALENGNDQREIISYLKVFIQRKFILQFGNLDCFEKQGLAMLVSDNLDYKLDWNNSDNDIFFSLINALQKENNTTKMINILGLYNYASTVYGKMKTVQQKEMFESVVSLSTENIVFNLSLIYALDNNTSYFSAIINNPDSMYKGDKYKEIFYVNRDGKMILNLFRNGDAKFIAEINDLVGTPYQDIYNMTTREMIDTAIDVVDYASWATMIIPGVGIAANIGKALAKASVKQAIKAGIKKSTKNTYKLLKNQSKDIWNDSVKYTASKTRNRFMNKGILRADQLFVGAMVIGIAYRYFFNEEQKQLCTGVEK